MQWGLWATRHQNAQIHWKTVGAPEGWRNWRTRWSTSLRRGEECWVRPSMCRADDGGGAMARIRYRIQPSSGAYNAEQSIPVRRTAHGLAPPVRSLNNRWSCYPLQLMRELFVVLLCSANMPQTVVLPSTQ